MVSILDVCAALGFNLSPRSTAACPFHGEKTPSFHVYPDSPIKEHSMGHYHCFGCGAHGDAIDLYAQLAHVSNREAFIALIAKGEIGSSQLDRKAQKRLEAAKAIQAERARIRDEAKRAKALMNGLNATPETAGPEFWEAAAAHAARQMDMAMCEEMDNREFFKWIKERQKEHARWTQQK